DLHEPGDLSRTHVGVGIEARRVAEPLQLPLPCRLDSLPDRRTRLRRGAIHEICIRHRWHAQMDVHPVEQRPADPRQVALHRLRRTTAGPCRVTRMSAGTGVHCQSAIDADGTYPKSEYPKQVYNLGDEIRSRRLDLGFMQAEG